jgi:hypothetical protein
MPDTCPLWVRSGHWPASPAPPWRLAPARSSVKLTIARRGSRTCNAREIVMSRWRVTAASPDGARRHADRGAGARLSDPQRHHPGAVRSSRRHRRAGARSCAHPREQIRQVVGHREPDGRRHDARRGEADCRRPAAQELMWWSMSGGSARRFRAHRDHFRSTPKGRHSIAAQQIPVAAGCCRSDWGGSIARYRDCRLPVFVERQPHNRVRTRLPIAAFCCAKGAATGHNGTFAV